MFNSLQQSFSSSNSHPPENPPTESPQHGNSPVTLEETENLLPSASASTSTTTKDRFLCTICVDTPDSPLDVAVLPACNHSFCLPCLASWSTVRQVCPNCKTSFNAALLRRDLDSLPVCGPPTENRLHPMLEHPIDAICQSSWITLHKIHSPKHDIEASFSLPPRDLLAAIHAEDVETRPSFSQSVPYFVNEDYEDELEDRIWQEEEYHHERLLRRTRTVSNRRYGPSGFIAAGRMRATPRPQQPQTGSSSSHASQHKTNFKAMATKKTQPAVTSSSHNISCNSTSGSNTTPLPHSLNDNSVSNGGRKKKLKKKSRAGLAAAKAAAEKAAAEKAQNRSFSTQEIQYGLERVAIGNTVQLHADAQSDDLSQ